ncbi:MAG: TetR/AcrR family transcriptional regulator, partial [Polyangia bacterium]|nr:TetR/AcrR family transcriptional regulator [Polyangia bacterium]
MVQKPRALSKNGPSRRNLEDRILRAAARVFGRCGYSGATIQEVAREAKVTKPTVYNYFKNKPGLYSATLDWAHELTMSRQEAAAALPGSSHDKILAVLKEKVQFA